jgi:hypothetical protein
MYTSNSSTSIVSEDRPTENIVGTEVTQNGRGNFAGFTGIGSRWYRLQTVNKTLGGLRQATVTCSVAEKMQSLIEIVGKWLS